MSNSGLKCAPDPSESDAVLAEQRVRALFDHSPFAIQIFAPNGQTSHVNRAYTELWGLSLEQLAQFNVLDNSRLEAAGLAPLIRRGFAGEAITIPSMRYTSEATPTIQGGRAHWLRAFIYPVTDQGGSVCEVMILFEDVTVQEESYQLLEQRVAERTRELSSLLEVSRNVTATLDLQTLFSLILDQMKTLIDYSGATIFSIQGHEFRILDYRGPIARDQLAQLRFPIEAALANQEVMRTRAPLIIDDVRADTPLTRSFQELSDGQITTTFGYIRSWLGVPLLVQDHVVGMLTLDHDQPGHYTPRHADLALTVANQAAIAIENARLFEQAQSLAVMVERQRLARELHDSVSQALYGIALGARTARALLDRDPAAAVEPIEYVAALANAGMAEMRALIFELRPESLEEKGLVMALTDTPIRCAPGTSLMCRSICAPSLTCRWRQRGALPDRAGGATQYRQARPRQYRRVTGARANAAVAGTGARYPRRWRWLRRQPARFRATWDYARCASAPRGWAAHW